VLAESDLASPGRLFFFLLCCCALPLLHFLVLVLPRQGMPGQFYFSSLFAVVHFCFCASQYWCCRGRGCPKKGMPNLGMPYIGMQILEMSKVGFPNSGLPTLGSPKLCFQVLPHMISEATWYQHLTNLASLVGAGVPSWQGSLLELLIHTTIQASELSLGWGEHIE
jgi:hypothetical protein